MNKAMRNHIHFFVLLAFLVGIFAPACGFAWGKNVNIIEICTVNGIETRLVGEDEQPDPAHLEEECQFCVTHNKLEKFIPSSIEVVQAKPFFLSVYLPETDSIFYTRTQPYTARAPPALL